MRSVKNIIKIVKGVKYISISIEEAKQYQEKGIKLYQIDNGKSLYIKFDDLEAET